MRNLSPFYGSPLQAKKKSFYLQSRCIPREISTRANNAMTRHNNHERVDVAGHAYGTGSAGVAQETRHASIRHHLSIRYGTELPPHGPLKLRAAQLQWQIKGSQPAGKIRIDLPPGLLKQRGPKVSRSQHTLFPEIIDTNQGSILFFQKKITCRCTHADQWHIVSLPFDVILFPYEKGYAEKSLVQGEVGKCTATGLGY